MTDPFPCAFSIHDVMPQTLSRVESLFKLIQSHGHHTITLLVVPGCEWNGDDLHRLNALLEQGGVAAGHGWRHKVRHIRGLKHRLHSLFISKDVAEHLALNRQEAMQLVRDCYEWFAEQCLPAPALYVPPAWAMGPLRPVELEQLPFQYYEVMGAVYAHEDRHWHPSPMLGFEARERWRVPFIRLWNWLNYRRAMRTKVLRIGIHPDDDQLYMAEDLHYYLQKSLAAVDYAAICK